MAHSSRYFPNASNTIINNPTITHVNGNASFSSLERRGLKLLLDNVCRGAFHDAAERGDPPKCHPNTRVAIREEIMEWIKSPEANHKLIMWMYGPAGSGKTAIAQSIAEECKKQGLLAASFFFSRTAPGRNDTTQVIATIAYQISRCLPQVENNLITAIEQDLTIFSRALATQMQVLVIGPLKSVVGPLDRPILVVLDGLDESGPSAQAQADLLDAIGTAIAELQPIPLVFFVASRPEYEIREAFSGPNLYSLMRPLVLNNNYNPDADIRLYFDSTFRQIHDKHLRLGARLPSPWPSKRDINILVSKSSGQFIFAATVLKFIDSARHNPAERLDIILGLMAAGDETPFALLDALYLHILSSVTNLSQVLEVLTLLLLNQVLSPIKLTVGVIDELLGINVRRALIDMHALVFVPPSTDDYNALRIYHASLSDFLMDRSRSHECHIGVPQGHIALTRHWLHAIGNRQIFTKISFSDPVGSFLIHCKNSPVSSEIASDLANFDLKALLEDMFSYAPPQIVQTPWKEFFDCVKRQVKMPQRKFFVSAKQQSGYRADTLIRLQGEFLAFFIDRILKYPPALRAYIPTILALSHCTMSTTIFRTLLYAVCQSQKEMDEIQKLDSALLHLDNFQAHEDILRQLFEDRSLAGQYHVHSVSYLILAKQIASVLFPKPTESGEEVKFQRTFTEYHATHVRHLQILHEYWFTMIISKASRDFDFAQFLLNHALQYRDDTPSTTKVMQSMARTSLTYVQRCGLPYLKHTHRKGPNKCIVCDNYSAASVIDLYTLDSQSYRNTFFENVKFSIRSRLGS